jgi:hypothetical protein
MNISHAKMERYTATRIRYLFDSESVGKEKRYKLGAWLHGEYRDKFKKAVKQIDAEANKNPF